jgi:TatD DNase family protein
LIDSHAHVGDEGFDGDRERVLERARDAGLSAIVCIGQDLATSRRALALASRGFPGLELAATAGLHPHESKRASEEREGLERLAKDPGIAAVGETGLDFHYDLSPRPAQRESFRRHLALARALGKPAVVHVREAHREAIEDLRAEGSGVDAVLHCFTGSADEARSYLELGAWISFSGILTFRNAPAVRDAARIVPADRLLIETDSPFLAPEPMRGQRCEPAYVAYTLARLAETRREPQDALAERTSASARALFFRRPARAG